MIFKLNTPKYFMLVACLILAFGIIYSIIPNTNSNFAFKVLGAGYLIGFLQFTAFLGFVCFVGGVGYQYLIKIGRQSETLMKVHGAIGLSAAIVSATIACTLTRSRLLENGDMQLMFLGAFVIFLTSQILYVISLAKAL